MRLGRFNQISELPDHVVCLVPNSYDQIDSPNHIRRQVGGCERDEHHLLEIGRIDFGAGFPCWWQNVMRFVDHDPVGPSGPAAKFEQIEQELLEKGRTIIELHTNDVGDDALFWRLQSVQNFRWAGLVVRIAQHQPAVQFRIVSFRIDHERLVISRQQVLQK